MSAPAEVCERLKQALGDFEVFAQADGTGDYVECRINKEDLTAALLLIEQGEKERERLAMAEACLAEIRAMMPKEQEGVELPKCVFDMQQALAAATERVKLWPGDSELLDWLESHFSHTTEKQFAKFITTCASAGFRAAIKSAMRGEGKP